MEVLQALLILIVLFIVPALLGTFFAPRSFGRGYIDGVLILWFLFQIICLISIKATLLFSQMSGIFSIVLIVVSILSIIFLILTKGRHAGYLSPLKDKQKNRMAVKEVIFILPAFLLTALTFFVYRPLLETRYAIPETVTTILGTDSLHQFNPLTGQIFAQEPSILDKLLNLPAFYAWLTTTFDVQVTQVLFKIIPVWILFCSFLVFYQLADRFFPKQRKGRVIFMWSYAAVLLCGDVAYMNEAYQILHYAYEGVAVVTCILMPFLLLVLLEGLAAGWRKDKVEKHNDKVEKHNYKEEKRKLNGIILIIEIVLILAAGIMVTKPAFGPALLGVMLLLAILVWIIDKLGGKIWSK